MRVIFIASIFVPIIFVLLHTTCANAGRKYTYTPEKKAILLMDEEELALRTWSLDAVSRIMSFNHDNLMARLAYNKALQTGDACKRFLWVLEKFEINEAIDRKETVITSYDSKFPLRHTLERIGVDPASKKQTEKLGFPENTKIWDVHIPLTIEYSKKLKKQRYNFMANVRVLARSDKIGDYVIIDWNIDTGRNTMIPDDNPRYSKNNYKECGMIDFADIEYLKKNP